MPDMHGCGSSSVARGCLERIPARATMARQSVMCATSLPSARDALAEVRQMAECALEASWADAEAAFSALLDCGRCAECRGTLICAATARLAEEAVWLRALVALTDDHLAGAVSGPECADAVQALQEAFAGSE